MIIKVIKVIKVTKVSRVSNDLSDFNTLFLKIILGLNYISLHLFLNHNFFTNHGNANP